MDEDIILESASERSSWKDRTPGQTEVRIVADFQAGWRLDLFLVHHFPEYSRVLLRKAIQSEGVFVDGKRGKPAYRLVPGQKVEFTLPELPRESPVPEDIPLEILYEDEDLAVVNKPPDMVVHPSRGHWSGTMVGALAFRYANQLSTVRGPGRPGIVHRLDRDTSGAILVAKNDIAHARLAALFENKKIQKEYFAIVLGVPNVDRDIVDLPIGHHPKNREKMRIAPDDPEAKQAQTFFEVADRFRGFSTIRALPKTGRTHQIRVHLAHYGCPVLCDKLYGGRAEITLGEIAGMRELRSESPENADQADLILLNRQALHARKITFLHPESGKQITVEAPIPKDMEQTIAALKKYRSLDDRKTAK
ncbi:MAG: RluA family pseudouridine synthase [Planctomycetia bacterium]|nr:RluA family pseudouridine synthase [Planctomycetia bacterium]